MGCNHHQDPRALQQRAREAEQLPLAHGEALPALADPRRQPVAKRLDEGAIESFYACVISCPYSDSPYKRE